MSRRLSLRVWLILLAIAGLVAAAVVAATGGGAGGSAAPYPPARADLTPYDGRSPSEPGGAELRVLVELSRPPLGGLRDAAGRTRRAQRAYVRSLAEEGRTLRSALQARGVELRDVRSYQRIWHGFAATVAAQDVASLSSLGVHAQPVRRFYPALSEPAPAPGPAPSPQDVASDADPVAVLSSGVDAGAGPLDGRTQRGFDELDGDRDPAPGRDPRDVRRREQAGTALAAVVAAAGERVLPIRVAGLVALPGGAEELATTDQLLAGLERAVDPDGDGATDDAVRVALIGVHAPYAGFAGSPEAEAIAGADALGTLVVAPAGHEGAGRDGVGTVGSPGAAAAALTVGALADPGARATVPLTVGETRINGAALLGGALPPQAGLRSAAPISDPSRRLLGRAGARLRGRVAIVRAGDNPAAAAAAAAAAGAELVVLAEPRPGRALPAIPAGRIGAAALGVTGEGAAALLESPGGVVVRWGAVRAGRIARRPTQLAPASSRGPALSGARKPELAAPAAARTVVPGGAAALAGGTGIAAAQVAVEAARLARQRPAETPEALRAALAAGGEPPPAAPKAAPVPIGPLEITGAGRGVRFTVGAFERGDPFGDGTRLEAAARLELTLLAGREVVRRLTPPGGARDLLPAQYAYTLPGSTRTALPRTPLRFRVVARAPRGGAPSRRTSAAFRLP